MNILPSVEVRDARLPEDIEAIRHLWLDYLTWGNDRMQFLYGVHPHNPKEAVEGDIKTIEKFLPPEGRLLLAFREGKACGIGCLKSINAKIGEIKRMYVDPTHRKTGAGRALLSALLHAAKEAGYQQVRLDSPKFMEAAHALYRSAGFKEIPPYPEMEISPAFKDFLLFMELDVDL